MSEIIHSTYYYGKGPWLLKKASLLELDKLVDYEWEKLVEWTTNEEQNEKAKFLKDTITKFEHVDEKAAEKLWRPTSRCERELLIFLSGDRRVPVPNFESAFREPLLVNETPIGFSLEVTVKNIRCKLCTGSFSSLTLSVSPDEKQEARRLFAALRNWIGTVNPPLFQVLWRALSPLQWSVFAAVCWVAIQSVSDPAELARATRQTESLEILRTGVSSTNQAKALELILSYQCGAIPSAGSRQIPTRYLWFVVSGVVVCLALHFRPKILLGIGKGEDSISKWERWMTFVGITFPVWLVGTWIWPRIWAYIAPFF